MANPMVTIHNTETGVIVEREMTAQEFAAYTAEENAEAARVVATEKEAAALKTATAKLAALGLTAADLQALGL